MKMFSRIIYSALLVSNSALIAHPINELSGFAVHQPMQIPDLRTLSYDEVLDLLSRIESDSFDERYSIEELDQINRFVSLLAMEGATDEEKLETEYAAACLFRNDPIQYAVLPDAGFGAKAKPAIYMEIAPDFILCKSWFKKQWDQTKSFVKKNKKAILIGAIVVVAVAVVVVAAVAISSSAASSAAAVAGAALGDEESTGAPKNESLTTSLQSQVTTFKETIAQEQFAAVSEVNGISMEENGRVIGSLFTHKAIDDLTHNMAQNPAYGAELKDWGFPYPIPGWLQTAPDGSTIMPHPTTDLAFSTDYTHAGSFGNLNDLSYQMRGDLALNSQCYTQAVQDFGSAISLDPNNPTLYLERGIANFELGNYELSIDDYHQFVEKKAEPFSVTDFSLGFAKGVPKGAYESGKGTLLFLSEFVTHPVHTSKQVVDSITQLAILVKNDEFGVVAETLSPELHQLVTQWETLPSEARGELAGYGVGKLGTDLLAPGAVAKVASKSVSSAKELAAVCKNLQIAQETLVLETAAGIGIPAKVSEIVEMGKKTAALGEELGLAAPEIGQLQKAGKLEATLANTYEYLSPEWKKSFIQFDKAQKFLRPYKGFMPESQARALIHQTGIKTFPRPCGIPENYRVKLSDNGAGMKYVHPMDEGTYIRVMPGKPHSPNSYQQKPYVTYQKNGNTIDKYGNIVEKDALEAHIPYEEFIYRE